MIINLIADSSVASAATGFAAAIRTAANVIQAAFTDNITLNIRYGWGSFNNVADPSLTGSGGAYAGNTNGTYVSYATTKSWLSSNASSSDDATALASLPASNASLPSTSSFFVSSAQQKAFGTYTGLAGAIDGMVAFGTGISSGSWIPVALHEITHAMGRTTGYYEGAPVISDLFRYDTPGHYQWTGGTAASFSINGGTTVLAHFDTTSDYGDLVNDSLAPNDSYDAYYNSNTAASLTTLDLRILDVLGFTRPTTGTSNFSITDTTTSTTSSSAGTPYSGPVSGLAQQFIYTGTANLNVTANAKNSFIHTGSGVDAINVSAVGGTNVLDGGTNSNFLVGGIGAGSNDTFFVDDRSPPGSIWSTVVNFHAGDSATVFGISSTSAQISWADAQGATGYQGLTLHAITPLAPAASLTLAGYTTADLNNGRLTTSFGLEGDGTPYFYVHANF